MNNMNLTGEAIFVRDEMVLDRSGKSTSIWTVYQYGRVIAVEFTNASLIPDRVDFEEKNAIPRPWLRSKVA